MVVDLLDSNHLIEDDGVILFLDFYKAFDTVEHPFILKALPYFGFGKQNFIDLISLLYSDSIVLFLYLLEHLNALMLDEESSVFIEHE